MLKFSLDLFSKLSKPSSTSMIRLDFIRLLSAEPKASNSNLFKLRKATGYALAKCKEALEKHNGNVEEATKWLNEQAQKEGWTKAEKLKNRVTTQGTLVYCADKENHKAAIVELNCETDFVARNEKFLDLSSNLAKSVLTNAEIKNSKNVFNKDELIKLRYLNESTRTIGDQLAIAIGNLGENMSLKRAVILKAEPDQYLGWYMHGSIMDPLNHCHFGRYGAMVNFSMSQQNENYKPIDIGRQLAQHVVGMKPTSIGERPAQQAAPTTSNPDETVAIKIDENDTRLLYQEFLMKPNTRVLEFVTENHAVVNDFVRLECGEETSADTK